MLLHVAFQLIYTYVCYIQLANSEAHKCIGHALQIIRCPDFKSVRGQLGCCDLQDVFFTLACSILVTCMYVTLYCTAQPYLCDNIFLVYMYICYLVLYSSETAQDRSVFPRPPPRNAQSSPVTATAAAAAGYPGMMGVSMVRPHPPSAPPTPTPVAVLVPGKRKRIIVERIIKQV